MINFLKSDKQKFVELYISMCKKKLKELRKYRKCIKNKTKIDDGLITPEEYEFDCKRYLQRYLEMNDTMFIIALEIKDDNRKFMVNPLLSELKIIQSLIREELLEH